MTMKRVAGQSIVGLALSIAACGEPRCPSGYDKRGDICHKIRDAGPDGATSDDSDAEIIADGAGLDAAVEDDAAASDAGGVACNLKCAEHEVCTFVAGEPQCACGPGYDACEIGCVDLASDPSNCGSCGYACESGVDCKDGACEQKIRELVLGGDNSCALYDAASGQYPLKCWGDTHSRVFRDAAMEVLTPRTVVGVPKVRGVAIAWTPNDQGWQCVTMPDRDIVRCWGTCGSACGNAATVSLSDQFFDNSVPAIARAYASSSATCTLNGVGALSCWGDASMSVSGMDETMPRLAMPGGHGLFDDLSLGASHGCGVTRDRGVVCWGANTFKQLGAATDANTAGERGVFVVKEGAGLLGDVIDVEAGMAASCAVTASGELWCWGMNVAGAIGSGDANVHVGAVQVQLTDVSKAAVGWFHACALVRDGRVYCWGSSPFLGLGEAFQGDLQDGAAVSRPELVPGLDEVIELRAGKRHTCARRRNGQVLCWGSNDKGQLGDGTSVVRFRPTPVSGLY